MLCIYSGSMEWFFSLAKGELSWKRLLYAMPYYVVKALINVVTLVNVYNTNTTLFNAITEQAYHRAYIYVDPMY